MKRFTPKELEVMQILWKDGPLKPPEIEDKFNRPVNNATLRSTLLVLLEKGHVKRTREGRAYYYEAVTPEDGALKRMIRQVTDTFFEGSTAALIAQLIESEKLSDDEISELQKIARKKNKDASKKSKKRRA
jgi:predicted transcriptional regulator